MLSLIFFLSFAYILTISYIVCTFSNVLNYDNDSFEFPLHMIIFVKKIDHLDFIYWSHVQGLNFFLQKVRHTVFGPAVS